MTKKEIQKVADYLKTQIGRVFSTKYSLEYLHGRMVSERLLRVKDPEDWHNGYVEHEATFTDGFKANYCCSIDGFYNEHKDEL